jgi:AraC-like DNA-binding protein
MPLSQYSLFQGDDVDQARQALSGMHGPIRFEPVSGGPAFKIVISGLRLRSFFATSSFFSTAYEGASAEPLDHHMIQLTLKGTSTYDIKRTTLEKDDHIATVPGRTGVIIPSGHQVSVRPGGDNVFLGLIIPDQDMREFLSTWTGHNRFDPIKFNPMLKLANSRTSSFLMFLNYIFEELDRPSGLLRSPAALASLEHMIMTFMLTGLEHNLDGLFSRSAPEANIEMVHVVEQYLEANALKPVDMHVLSTVTGHSTGSIYRSFRRHRDYTPMQFLRSVRMGLARGKLLNPVPGDTVTKTAHECGFCHLGRFAVEYRRRFGESPSRTLERAVKDRL